MGSVCTGYGGLDLGVLAALGGGRVAWCADTDPHVARILADRMPGVPNLGDVRAIDWAAVEKVDVLVAGFPCQDISAAGKRRGIEKGERSGLWSDIVAGVRVLRPALCVVENVAALRWKGGGLHRVLGDLAEAGYDALWRSVRAADVGCAHRRERMFVLAWSRHRDDDVADADRVRRQLQRRQCGEQEGRSFAVRPAAAAADTDGGGLPVGGDPDRAPAGSPDAGRMRDADRLGPVAADATRVGHRNSRTSSRSGVPATAVATGPPAGGLRSIPADPSGHRRHEGLPGATGLQGRPDVALGDHPAAAVVGSGRHLVAVPGTSPDADRASAETSGANVNWGSYSAAVHRWEHLLGRPAPFPTQPGRHGRPVLAPAFVEHLMGLPAGWVTDLSLPRTAQLRALGNGVVPQQAAYAVALLLTDLAALLTVDEHSGHGREATAA